MRRSLAYGSRQGGSFKVIIRVLLYVRGSFFRGFSARTHGVYCGLWVSGLGLGV